MVRPRDWPRHNGVQKMINRRRFLICASALAGLAALSLPMLRSAHAQSERTEVPMDELMAEGQLADKVLGDENAPVTVIEYASMTCGHCASFHTQTYPQFKEKYVDTGQVRFILRDFPLDARAAVGSMVARCVKEDAYFDFVSLLFTRQEDWAFVEGDKVLDSLFSLAKQVGMSRAEFDACINDQKLFEGITAMRNRAEQEFGVQSTPTFFINGKVVRGALPFEEFEKELTPHLQG
jgi:protein-disulfide isomerase